MNKFLNLIKENQSKSNKSFDKFIKLVKSNQIVNYLKQRKYIFHNFNNCFWRIFLPKFLNKNNLVIDNSPLQKVKIDSSIEQKENLNNNEIKTDRIEIQNNERLKIDQKKEVSVKNLKIEEESVIDLLSPLISPSELDSEIPKGRLDPFNKTNILSMGDTNDTYLDLIIYGVISIRDKKYALIKSELGSALICPKGRGRCDKFSSNILPDGWEIIDIDINTGCAKFISKKLSEKSICMRACKFNIYYILL